MWYRKVLKKHDNSLPQKATMKPKVQRDLHFLRAGTMSGLEHFLGSEFRNHVLQCPSPPPQQVHQSSTAASKKASRDGKRFHQPCEKKPAIRNQSLIVGQFHPPVMDLIFLPGMKTPTIPWGPPAVGGDAHRSFCSGSSPSQADGKNTPDWLRWIEILPLRFRFCGKNDFQSELTLLENKTTKTCLPLKTNDKAGRLPFFSSQTCFIRKCSKVQKPNAS